MFGGSLFQSHASDCFQMIGRNMLKEIESVDNATIERIDATQFAAEIAGRHIVACPSFTGEIVLDEPVFSERAEAIVKVYLPFTGTGDLFMYSGGSAPILHEQIHVTDSQLVIQLPIERQRIGELESKVRALKQRIEGGLQHLQHFVKHGNEHLQAQARNRIMERKSAIAAHKNMLGDIQKTGFTLRRRNDGSEKVIVPVKPVVLPSLSAVAQPIAAASPEPELSVADYDEILSVIRSMVAVFERSPSVFRSMEEEHLRTILLVALNGVFKGKATGETFNGQGKTDILIRVNDKNIFIAECLIWHGPEHFKKKLTEQLFQYATWHDSKLAAIVFNRNKGFSAVAQRMKDVAEGLGNRVATLPFADQSGCRHQLAREDDPQRRFLLTCMAFEVPS